VIDATLRRKLSGSFNWLALKLDNGVITPTGLTVVGLLLGMASAASAWNRLWVPALLLWLTSRVLDALDGALARIKISHNISYGSVGGYLDIVFDFIVYGSFVVGVGHGAGTSYLPFLLVLLAYYINGTSFLAFSSIAEREQITIDDGRSLSFVFGLAETTETVVVHSLWCLLPSVAGNIAWVWAFFVGVSAVARIIHSANLLRHT
jgi:phosphatidylserine synthase